MRTLNWFLTVGTRRFGFEQNRVHIQGKPYLDRWIVYVGGGCFRLHRFWRGDDDRAPHDHPWNFWTLPLTSYRELVNTESAPGEGSNERNVVSAWRVHYRPAEYRHIVLGRADYSRKPFWTIVFTTAMRRKWGYWPHGKGFVYWRDWIPEAAHVKRPFS